MQTTEKSKLRINVFKLGSIADKDNLIMLGFNDGVKELACMNNTKIVYNPGEEFYDEAENVFNIIVIRGDDILFIGKSIIQYINEELSNIHQSHNFKNVTQSNFVFIHVGGYHDAQIGQIQDELGNSNDVPPLFSVKGCFYVGDTILWFQNRDISVKETLNTINKKNKTPNAKKVKDPNPDKGIEPPTEKEPNQPSPCAGLCEVLSKMNRGMKMNFIIYGTTCAAGAVTALALGFGLYSDALAEKLDPNLNVLTEALEKHGAERWAIVVIAAIVVTVITMIAMLCCISDKETDKLEK